MTMGMMSVMMGYTALRGVIDGSADIGSSMPTLVASSAMLMGMLLWPILQKKYQKRQTRKNEKERQIKYHEYLEEKKEKNTI